MGQRAKRSDRSVLRVASLERRALALHDIPFERCRIPVWAFLHWQLLHAHTFMVGLFGIETFGEDVHAQVLDRPCLRVLASTVVFVDAQRSDMHRPLDTALHTHPVLDAQCHGLPDDAIINFLDIDWHNYVITSGKRLRRRSTTPACDACGKRHDCGVRLNTTTAVGKMPVARQRGEPSMATMMGAMMATVINCLIN